MFDFGVGYSELFVLALVALIAIGPKDLPKVLRTFGQFMNKMRGMAREFQTHVDAAMKDTGLDELKREAQGFKADIAKSVAMPNQIGAGSSSMTSVSRSVNDFDKLFSSESGPGETRVAGKTAEAPVAPAE